VQRVIRPLGAAAAGMWDEMDEKKDDDGMVA
jgi:hypothetical protein